MVPWSQAPFVRPPRLRVRDRRDGCEAPRSEPGRRRSRDASSCAELPGRIDRQRFRAVHTADARVLPRMVPSTRGPDGHGRRDRERQRAMTRGQICPASPGVSDHVENRATARARRTTPSTPHCCCELDPCGTSSAAGRGGDRPARRHRTARRAADAPASGASSSSMRQPAQRFEVRSVFAGLVAVTVEVDVQLDVGRAQRAARTTAGFDAVVRPAHAASGRLAQRRDRGQVGLLGGRRIARDAVQQP